MRFNVIYIGSREIAEKLRNEDKKRSNHHKHLKNVCTVQIMKKKQENNSDIGKNKNESRNFQS